jgi:hypothetical protein
LGSKADWFTLAESKKLLAIIFPNYPDTRNPQPVPNLDEFLKECRKPAPGDK